VAGIAPAGRVTSFRIRRRLARLGIPQLDINARTRVAKVYAARAGVVDQLIADSQVEVLRALASGALAIEVVASYVREHGAGGSGLAAQVRLASGLWDALEDTLPHMGASEATRARYTLSRDQLNRRLPAGATVRDLLTVDWVTMRAAWTTSASDWMHLRRMLSRFLSVYLGGKHHPVRHEVLARIPRAAEVERVTELSPAQFHRLVEAARPDLRAPLWTLVLTGMRMGEYLRCDREHLRPAQYGVMVPGSKTAAATALVRVAPALWHWIDAGVPSPLQYKAFRAAFKAALKAASLPITTRLHDLRHAHGQWAVQAGAPEAMVQVSLRHTQAATTRRYTKATGDAVGAALAKSLKTPRRGKGA